MTDERRYQEDEVLEIFEAASNPGVQSGALASTDGLTLTELQAIGSEVGLSPDRIAAAASALELRRSTLPRQTSFGMPVAVGRAVDLPRAPTDREWGLLLGELRHTFNARGKDGSQGDLRQWTNGNLGAFVEPTETGYRFRLSTLKSNAAPVATAGVVSLVMALLMVVVLILNGDLAKDFMVPIILTAMGAGAIGYNAVRLPRWAGEREAQMEYLAARARAIVGPDPAGDDSAPQRIPLADDTTAPRPA